MPAVSYWGSESRKTTPVGLSVLLGSFVDRENIFPEFSDSWFVMWTWIMTVGVPLGALGARSARNNPSETPLCGVCRPACDAQLVGSGMLSNPSPFSVSASIRNRFPAFVSFFCGLTFAFLFQSHSTSLLSVCTPQILPIFPYILTALLTFVSTIYVQGRNRRIVHKGINNKYALKCSKNLFTAQSCILQVVEGESAGQIDPTHLVNDPTHSKNNPLISENMGSPNMPLPRDLDPTVHGKDAVHHCQRHRSSAFPT